MRFPRVVYAVVAGLLVVAGVLLPRYLANRSSPELGETVVVPAGSSTTPTPTPTPTPTKPTVTSTTGAEPVAPPPAQTAGPDDDDDDDDADDGDDGDDDDG